jgi:hypothetical protein
MTESEWVDLAHDVVRASVIILALITIGGMLSVVYRHWQDYVLYPQRARLRPLHVILLASSWLIYAVAVTGGIAWSWGRTTPWWYWLYAVSLGLALAGFVVIFRSYSVKRSDQCMCSCHDEDDQSVDGEGGS